MTIKQQPSGEQVIATVRAEFGPRTGVLFSLGKDSVAATLALRPHFDELVPVYLYYIPGLSFVEEALDYYERNLFGGRHIVRMPHPSLYRWLNNFVFQPPDRIEVIRAANLPTFDYADIHQLVRQSEGLPDGTLFASGVRAADSPIRRLSLNQHGPIRRSRGEFFPVWDWNKDRLVSEIAKSGLRLPEDYKLFGRSFDGIDARFLIPLKKHRPADYQRVLEWFPLAELEVFRIEQMRAA